MSEKDSKTYELEYVDNNGRLFMNLTYYGSKHRLPRKEGENIIKVTEVEKKLLLGMMNGNRPCFKEVRKRRVKEEEE